MLNHHHISAGLAAAVLLSACSSGNPVDPAAVAQPLQAEQEPNDSFDQANALIATESLFGTSNTNMDPEDYFRVRPTTSGRFVFTLGDYAGDLDLELRDEQGSVIAVSRSQDASERIVAELSREAIYFLVVMGTDTAGLDDDYRLDVANTEFASPACEPKGAERCPARDPD